MSGEERMKMVEIGLHWNGILLEPEVINKVIHVVDVVTRNGDSATLKTLKYDRV